MQSSNTMLNRQGNKMNLFFFFFYGRVVKMLFWIMKNL
jgi:hypothetical protein